jgi:hypothetical protein
MLFRVSESHARTLVRAGALARRRRLLAAAMGGLVLALASTGQGWESAKPSESGPQPSAKANWRMREGSDLVDQAGYFEISGDRIVFIVDPSGARLVGLENLGLERIANTLANDPGRLQWRVTGVVTEYRGTNFLLVSRAILRTVDDRHIEVPPPSAEKASANRPESHATAN